ncbi:MAG: hypothetical protein E7774_05825 [Bradyrhizobium sp.]|nr:MAG: hypothetical protein E7774_05825 [Bradyrhizobium sp.]
MLRLFLLSLVALGASAASADQEPQPTDISTWRWHVSTILDAQRDQAKPSQPVSIADSFDQRYQRYEGDGQPVPAAPVER